MGTEIQNASVRNNILLVIDDLGSGGAQNQITLLAKGLSDRNHNVNIITYYPSNFFADRLSNVNHIQLKKNSKLGINVVVEIRQQIKRLKIDVVLSFLDTPNLYVAMATSFLSKVKYFASYRSSIAISNLSFLSLQKHRFIIASADKLISNSVHERKNWQTKYPQYATKWKTIYNCVESDSKDEVNAERKNYIVIGSVGPAKNGLIILNTLNQLKNEKLKIDWYGEHVYHIEERKQYLDKMNDYIRDYHLENCFTWYKPIRNIQSQFGKYKALILASVTEGLPNVVCEAMMAGLPCIVSNTLDHPYLIDHGENGLLFEVNNVDSLTKSIMTIETMSKEDYEKMSTAAITKAKSLFDYNLFLDKYENELK